MTLVVYSVVCFVFNNVKNLCSLSQAVGRLTSCLDRRGLHWMACHAVSGSRHYALLFREADFHLWEQDYLWREVDLGMDFFVPHFPLLGNKGRCFFVSLTGMGRQLSWHSSTFLFLLLHIHIIYKTYKILRFSTHCQVSHTKHVLHIILWLSAHCHVSNTRHLLHIIKVFGPLPGTLTLTFVCLPFSFVIWRIFL